MAAVDPNLEWLGYVQPVGLVLSPAVLDRYNLPPEEQTRADSEVVAACLAPEGEVRALADPWTFFSRVLGWREHQVAGLPGGPPLPDGLSVAIEESDIALEPYWAAIDPEGRPTLLVRIEEPGVAPDQRGALAGWEATPHQRFERLLRENEAGVRAGILLTDDQLRLVYAPKGETSGWLSFPLRSLATVAGRPMLGGLKLALSAFRLHNEPPERRLPGLLKQSRDAQAEVSAKLAEQVLGALHQLLRGLHAADEARIAKLAAERPDHLYGGLLTVLLRLVFLLYAEDRGLIPSATDEEARRLYDQGYGVRALHAKLTADAARYPDTMDERRGGWARLLVLFRLVHAGGGDSFIKGRGGDLFDPTVYPFLLGQDAPGDRIAPAPVSDGCILGMLDKLLVLGGERLSYRTLDVEQIGSVYETVMGFTVETMSGPALALRGGKNDKVPVFVDLAELASFKGSERQKRLKDGYDIKLPEKVAKAVAAAQTLAEIEAALKPRVDERASPGATPAMVGSPLLQPTDERRRTGSHYTPRTLTEPIVRHALEPAFERLGPDAKPDEVLALKVCDPAMGSGAFLVEVCRQLAGRLVKAWTRWPETRPVIPPDEDEDLHARRLVAQRCLYGVDKNPRAVELAKLSLWLATLARDHEFTFLDHALKCGDSLVGLDTKQIAAMHWDASKPGLPLFRKFVADRVAEATKARAEIQSAPDDTQRIVLEQKHRGVEKAIEHVRVLGDAVLSAFFAESKPRAREKRRATIESWVTGNPVDWDKLHAAASGLRSGSHNLRPFHWSIEFPEVYARENPGFDAVVGNPPFLGGKRISREFGNTYFEYVKSHYDSTSGNADYVSYFFLQSHIMLRSLGSAGLIATSSIAQGETRANGLARIIKNGSSIYRAQRHYPWPGNPANVVSIIHFQRDGRTISRILDNNPVQQISAYLFGSGSSEEPARLAQNSNQCFQGAIVLGPGFIFGDDSSAQSLDAIETLVRANPANAERIFWYLNGEELNSTPTLRPKRRIINFEDMSLDEARRWPELLDHVAATVKPFRQTQKRADLRERWWQFAYEKKRLRTLASAKSFFFARSQVSKHHALGRIEKRTVVDAKLIAFLFDDYGRFAIYQSRVHELWLNFFGTTMGDRMGYTTETCFEAFPAPPASSLSDIGADYYDSRSHMMIARELGFTDLYNRFHDPAERSADIIRLRELHAEMDRAVLRAYGWDDLAERAEPAFLDETNEDDHTYQGRLFWPSAFRDEVLARLLALNAERAAAERAAGIVPSAEEQEEEPEADAA